MNHKVTSKEEILRVCRNLIKVNGWENISIRLIAKECGMATGSLYHYFGSKSELKTAMIQSVWKDIFHPAGRGNESGSIIDYMIIIYDRLRRGNEMYPGFLANHAAELFHDIQDKKQGELLMEQTWLHITQGIKTNLQADKKVRKEAFSGKFTAECFVYLLFSLILGSIVREEFDVQPVIEMIHRTIY